jgi:ATP-binding cassette subfamily B protein
MHKLFGYLKPMWFLVLLVWILCALQSYFSLAIPDLIGYITNIMTQGQDVISGLEVRFPLFGFVLVSFEGTDRITATWIIGGIMMAFALAFLLTAMASSLVTSKISAEFARCIRRDVHDKVIHFSVSQYDSFGTASLLTRTTNDVDRVENTLRMGMRIIIQAPVTLVVALIMILVRDWRIALIVAATIPFIAITAAVLLHFAAPLFTKIQQSFDRLTMVLRENLTGVRVIRAFNQEERESKRFDEASKDVNRIFVKVSRLMSVASPIINIMFDVTYIAIFFYGYASVDGEVVGMTDSAIAIDNIVVSAEYAMNLMTSFLMFAMLLIQIPQANASAKRIVAVLETVPSVEDKEGAVAPSSRSGRVEFKDVTFSYPGSDKPSLSGISFVAEPGKTTAIIGSTGSGKSTLVNLIPRLYDVSEGEVLVDGADVRDFPKNDLRLRIGFVPQQSLLFSGTVASNIRMGKKDATDEEIVEALRVAQAEHFVFRKGNGIESEVEQGGKNFSGGQKQRLSIARALVRKPEIYVFDDSFSALDFKTDVKLRMALKDYVGSASIIIVAQRVSTILDADNILVLDGGRLVGQGTHEELLRSCPVYQEIVYSQLDKDEIERTMALEKDVQEGENRMQAPLDPAKGGAKDA